MISFLSDLSHFYALTLKHSTLIYSHSCYSHRSWLPVHTLFSITSLSFVSHFIVPLYVSEEKGRKLVYTFTHILVVAMCVQTTRSWVFFGKLFFSVIMVIEGPGELREESAVLGERWATSMSYQSAGVHPDLGNGCSVFSYSHLK